MVSKKSIDVNRTKLTLAVRVTNGQSIWSGPLALECVCAHPGMRLQTATFHGDRGGPALSGSRD